METLTLSLYISEINHNFLYLQKTELGEAEAGWRVNVKNGQLEEFTHIQ